MNAISLFAAEGPNGYFIPADIKELWWGGAAFLIVMALMAWKLLPVIKKGLNDSQQAMVDEGASADIALADAQKEEADLRASLGDPQAEGKRIVAEAHEAANQLRVDSHAKTQQMVNDAWAKAQGDVSSLKTSVTSDLSGEVSTKALTAAEAIVANNLDDATKGDLIEEYIRKVASA